MRLAEIAKSLIESEKASYDKISAFKEWYKEQQKEIDKIQDFNQWKRKTKMLNLKYRAYMNKMGVEKNAYALAGDIKARHIYHYTDGDSLMKIIEDRMLIGGGDEYGGISFTSHPNLYKRGFVFWHSNKYSKGRNHTNTGVKIKFDFEKMKKDGLVFKRGNEEMGTHAGEDELRLMQDELDNPMKYVKEIIIFQSKESNHQVVTDFLDKHNVNYKLIK